MILYLDTSALFRLYVPEPGRAAVLQAVQASTLRCTHLIAYAEMHAALGKAERMRRLSRKAVDTILARFEDDWQALLVIAADEALIRRAGALARLHGLRGYDSVHLAAVERLAAAEAGVAFAVFDEALQAAARGLGLQVL